MKNIVTFSGGKDSLAISIIAKNQLQNFDVVFCDTGWESKKTYQHILDVENKLGVTITRLKSSKFKNLIDLFIKKKRAASTKARFCTEEMKVKPMIDYLLTQNDDIIIYQGVRADESEARSSLKQNDEYFKFYVEPYGYDKKGKPKYHTYRKQEVLQYIEKYTVDVYRPVLNWTADMVFNFIGKEGFSVNPLYYEGFSRVGCFPCVMCKQGEIKLIAENYKEEIEEIRHFELVSGKTFFPPNYIPIRFCTKRVISKKGKVVMCPTIDDVLNYVLDDKNQTRLFEKQQGCVSVYNICE